MSKATKLWKCNDGRKVRICDMETSHIKNCIAMLERRHAEAQEITLTLYPSFQGEMAQYYAEAAWDRDAAKRDEDRYPILTDLRGELSRRKVTSKEHYEQTNR